jgi:signal transduction histidine kinase
MVYHAIDEGIPFYLVKKPLAQARHKRLVQAIVVTGFLASVLAALLLALATVKNIIAPVRLLTTQVRGRKKITHELSPLAPEYPNDELGQLADAFDRTFLMLEEALQREELFTSDVSHELRTPLMMIRSSCELLIEKDQLDAYTQARIRVIARAAEEIQELVNAFLSLARDTPLEGEQATLLEVVESAKDSWQQYANERNLKFCIENLSDNDTETFSRPLLRAVLNNLVRNAIHHSHAGDMSLVLKKNGFEVRDTGSGISEKDRPLIYKPFYRGQTRETGGIGLGLSLSYRICTHEGWQLSYQNNQPTGSCFVVNFS